MSKSPVKAPPKWHHPSEVMKLHKLKLKKKALQARISGDIFNKSLNSSSSKTANLEEIASAKKRKNPFIKDCENKRNKLNNDTLLDQSTDQTLFNLLHQNNTSSPLASSSLTSFENILSKIDDKEIMVVKVQGEKNIPVDWTLKKKIRLWSQQPFAWNQKLKMSEEASGTTGFVRCLDTSSNGTSLDASPNAKFHQCCLYWQQPSLPWLSLFPRVAGRVSESNASIATNPTIKHSLQMAWSDSLRSLFQLIRTKQCPYFYLCANNFTLLVRAAGICGISEVHALITPTTKGFRQLLTQENIEFTMPLKKKRTSDQGYESSSAIVGEDGDINAPLDKDEDDLPDEKWLQSMGINAEDIKQINYTQAKIAHKAACEIDNSEQSLVFIEGDIHSLYNFLINCKSATPLTGVLAGIPPTLLAPVAFNGATLNALKVRESKVHVDNSDFYSLELNGPILPSTIHNIFAISSSDHNMSATFVNVASTLPFSKIDKSYSAENQESKGNVIFNKENLSECGLNKNILELFCNPNSSLTSLECLKYNSDSKTFTWT